MISGKEELVKSFLVGAAEVITQNFGLSVVSYYLRVWRKFKCCSVYIVAKRGAYKLYSATVAGNTQAQTCALSTGTVPESHQRLK